MNPNLILKRTGTKEVLTLWDYLLEVVFDRACIKIQSSDALLRFRTGGINSTNLDVSIPDMMVPSVEQEGNKTQEAHDKNLTYTFYVDTVMTQLTWWAVHFPELLSSPTKNPGTF